MFHRRPRTPSNAHLNTDPTPSAATAAAQAFLAHRASNAALSAAAAATALRSHSTTPVSVAEVQTKRTVQRRQSVSSNDGIAGGGPPGASDGVLRRRGSSGSMTERSFRDSSPARSAPRGIVDPSIPPVPALPKELPPLARSPIPSTAVRPATAGGQMPPPIPDKSHRRASSVEPVVPGIPRMASPPPGGAHGRGKSVDAGAAASAGLVAAQRASNMASAAERGPARPESRSSVNFSYPMSPRSPTPLTDEQTTGADPAWAPSSPPRIRSPDPATARKKKKSLVEGGSAVPRSVPREAVNPNSRPASASADLGLRGHYNVGTSLPLADEQNNAAAPPKRKKKKQQLDSTPTAAAPRRSASADLTSTGPYSSDLDTISEDGDNEMGGPQRFKTRAGALLVKQPSVVRENRALEEEGERSETSRNPGGNAPRSAASTTGAQAAAEPAKVLDATPSGKGAERRIQSDGPIQHTRSASQPATAYSNSSAATGLDQGEELTRTASVGQGRGTSRGSRPQSLSPSRNAHFAKSTSVSSPLAIKHEPPPRSLSPAKSAMRKSPSPRPGSAASQVSSTGFAGQAQKGNETAGPLSASDIANIDSGSAQRRKTSRVSFDEESVVIEDEATSAVTPVHAGDGPAGSDNMPKDSMRGYSGHLDQRRDRGNRISADLDDEDFSKPRPALPTFGSVRRQKEGTSARPGVTTMSPAPEAGVDRPKVPLEASSDHAIGGIIARDLSARGTPQADSIDALPSDGAPPASGPTMTSDTAPTTGIDPASDAPNGAPIGTSASDEEKPQAQEPGDVPSIEFTQPTPNLEQPSSVDSSGGLLVPSVQTTQLLGQEGPKESDHIKPPSPTPALAGLAEPEPEEVARSHGRRSPVVGHVAETLLHQAEHLESDDSEETEGSLYSDAAEDITQTEGDGFGSIDAVVDSPTVDSTPGLAITTPPESPSTKMINGERLKEKQKVAVNGTEPSDGADWGQVQRHWKDVNERQRGELKQATPAPAGISSAPAPKPKVKKRKEGPSTTGGPATAQPQPAALGPRSAKKSLGVQGVASGNGRVKAGVPAQDASARSAARRTKQNSLPAVSRPSTGPAVGEPALPRTAPRKTRPASSAAAPRDPFSEAVRNEIHRMGADRPATALPTAHKKGRSITSLRRRGSDSSASSSSFKKSRPRSTASGAVSLRRTMRPDSQSAASPMSPTIQPSSFSVRSLSPAGSSRKPMRSTLRGPSSRGAPSLRPMSADAAKPPSSFRNFGKSSKVTPASRGLGQKFRRFSDSSDDGAQVPTFRGRYDDSSDDEEVGAQTAFTPVRGIPRRTGEENEVSSELPDSSDDEARKSRAKATQEKKTETGALAAGTLRFDETAQEPGTKEDASKGHKKRRSLFSAVLGRRRRHDDESKVQRNADVEETPTPTKVNGFARRAASASLASSAAGGANRPALAKRSSSQANSESWPIPASSPPPSALRSPSLGSPAATDRKRPTTSDGVTRRFPWGQGRRPDTGPRRISNPLAGSTVGTRDFTPDERAKDEVVVPEQVDEEEEEDLIEDGDPEAAAAREQQTQKPKKPEKHVAFGRNGKKKKFAKLRRMLGIYD